MLRIFFPFHLFALLARIILIWFRILFSASKKKTYIRNTMVSLFDWKIWPHKWHFYQWWCITFSSSLIILCYFTSQRTHRKKRKRSIMDWQTIFKPFFEFSRSPFPYSLFTLPSLWPSFISLWSIFQNSHSFIPSIFRSLVSSRVNEEKCGKKEMKRDTKFTIIVFIFIGFCGCCASVHCIASLFDVIACN